MVKGEASVGLLGSLYAWLLDLWGPTEGARPVSLSLRRSMSSKIAAGGSLPDDED